MSDHSELKRWATEKENGAYDYGLGVQILALISDLEVSNNVSRSLTETLESVCESRDALVRVVEQLKVENSGLRTGYEAYEQVNAELKAEVEGLRRERDARHPFKPFHEPAIGFTGCVICGAYTDHGGLPCPKTRAAANALAMENQRITPVEPLRVPHPLDAAMGKGEQS